MHSNEKSNDLITGNNNSQTFSKLIFFQKQKWGHSGILQDNFYVVKQKDQRFH